MQAMPFFAAAWPSRTDDAGFADRMNSLPNFVVSTTPQKTGWNNSRLIKTNVAEEIRTLKQQAGQDILVSGSGTLAQTLIQHGLVDAYCLLVYPVVLGTGKRLFDRMPDKLSLKLVSTKSFASGVVALEYGKA